MTNKSHDPNRDSIHDLLERRETWARAAEKIREKIGAKFTHKHLQETLGLSQPTIWRFMNGDPTRRAFQKHSQQLVAFLREIGLPLEDLRGELHSDDRWLCIDRIETEPDAPKSVVECPSLLFRAAGDHAEAIPMDPRSHKDERYCRYCGTQLSSHCPYCPNVGVVAGSHCPGCGESYVAGAPQELRGLVGQDLVRACDKRNQANRQAREHAELRSFS